MTVNDYDTHMLTSLWLKAIRYNKKRYTV